MAHNRATRSRLRHLYVADRQPLKVAARMAAIGYSTAMSWKREALRQGDDWDHARMAENLGDGGVRELTRVVLGEFVPLFRSTIEELRSGGLTGVEKAEAISRLSDAYTKTVKASGAVDPAMAKLGWSMDVLRLLAQFCAERFPQHQAVLVDILEPFGERLAAEFG
jgi:hypothetical protein